jgi:hypothetical protein
LVEELQAGVKPLHTKRVDNINDLIAQFLLQQSITPLTTLEFEEKLQEQLRELGREVMEWTLNQIEPEDPQQAPHFVYFEGGEYRRNGKKSNLRHGVSTTFGVITLRRYGYRYTHRQPGEPTIFPLELQLGLIEGATPALAKLAGRYMSEAGASQIHVLQRLRYQHQVFWSVDKLRTVTEAVSEKLESMRQQVQVSKVLELLHQAYQSKGRHRPVLAVGRDGVTIRLAGEGNKVAAVATISVYDRRGHRLGTVYLGEIPEEGQTTLTRKLTSLIRAVLKALPGNLPRLCYVTDDGDHEHNYFYKALRGMRDPRFPHRRLDWIRVVDYYHVTTRIYTIARAILGEGEESDAWAHRMCRMLLQPNGVSRVLHSAAAMRCRYGIRQGWEDKYALACNYIRQRSQYLRYAEYRRLGLPIGSGVTEAACKTVFAQRLKLSGMRWKREGAEWIVHLRVILLSKIWDETFEAMIKAEEPVIKVTRVSNQNF